jgi:hypothetical protein
MRQSRYPAAKSTWSRRWSSLSVCFVLLVVAAGCHRPPKAAPAEGPQYFATPDAAGKSLYDAAKSGSAEGVLAIFGPGAKEYLLTGNPADDRAAMAAFATDYEQMHRWSPLERGGMVMNVGAENYPFPFPLKKTPSGQWFFDTAEAKQEFAARLVGDNELNVLAILKEGVAAEAEYFSKPRNGAKIRQYAQKIRSTEGQQDGLYWEPAPGEPQSPLGPVAARASAEGYEGTGETPEPFHGYFYRILTAQGPSAKGGEQSYLENGKMTRGFAILAYPAKYRVSGVMTFIVSQDGQIFQKDLGPDTVTTAKAINKFDPDESWSMAE